MARILIVENDQSINTSLKKRLDTEEHSIAIAQSCQDAMHKAQEIDPQVILLDMDHDESDGLNCLKNYHDLDTSSDAITVMLSGASTEDSSIQEAKDMGAYKFISKEDRGPAELATQISYLVKKDIRKKL